MSLQLVLQRADTMEKMDFAHQNNLSLEDKLQMTQLGVYQLQGVGRVQTADGQQLSLIRKEVSDLRSSSLDQQNPELLQIKKEEEELWISQDGEELTVKIVDEENLQLSELHHIHNEDSRETGASTSSPAKQLGPDGGYCGGTELNRNPEPAGDRAGWQEVQMKKDEQQLLVIKVEVPDPWRSRLDQQDTEPLQKTREEEELWISQEGEHLTVMSEGEEEKPPQIKTEDGRETDGSTSSTAEQMETESEGEDSGGPEPDKKSDPHAYLQSNGSDCSETEISGKWWSGVSGDDGDEILSGSGSRNKDCDDVWKEMRTHQSSVNCSVEGRTAMKPFSCPECCKRFVYQQSFLKHLTCHSGEKSSSCLADMKQTIAKAGKKSVVCVVCGKMFKDQYYLKCHMRLHTGEKPFSCDVCGKTFRHSHILKLHLRIHTGEKPFTCDECGKTFTKLQNLKGHMTCHTGEKPFRCEQCGKKFSQRGTLRNHMMIHKGEKPFACSGCDKHFRLKADLQKHTVTHTGVKAFFCRYCGGRFAHRGALTRHIRRHTGEKPFACDKCDKRFYRNSELKYHLSVHTRDWKQDTENRKFACKECGKKYIRKVHLTAHMSSHLGEKPFSCSVCSVSFTRHDSLKRHTMRAHSQ